MIDLNEIVNSTQKDLIVLQNTHKITKADLNEPKYIWLKKMYDGADQALNRYFVSLVNSIITQDRVVFVITREKMASLIKNDQNHDSGFDNNLYKGLFDKIRNSGLFNIVSEGTKTKPFVIELVSKDIIGLLKNPNRESQLEQALNFTNQTSKTDIKADTVVSSKKVVVSSICLISGLYDLINDELKENSLDLDIKENPEFDDLIEGLNVLSKMNNSGSKILDNWLIQAINSDLDIDDKFEHLKIWSKITGVKPDVEFQRYFKQSCNILKFKQLVDLALLKIKDKSWITSIDMEYLKS